jgi:hypothetical protein
MPDNYATNDIASSGLESMGNALRALNIQDTVFAQQQYELVQSSDFTDPSLHSSPYTGSVIESELDSGIPSEYDLALIAGLDNGFTEPDGMGFAFDNDSPGVVALGDDEIELRSMSSPQSGVESIGGLNTVHAWDIVHEMGNTFLTPVPDEWVEVEVEAAVKTEQPPSPRKPYVPFCSLLTVENSKDTIEVFPKGTTRKGSGESFVVQSAGRCTGRYVILCTLETNPSVCSARGFRCVRLLPAPRSTMHYEMG